MYENMPAQQQSPQPRANGNLMDSALLSMDNANIEQGQ
jgi:hypothetical protein